MYLTEDLLTKNFPGLSWFRISRGSLKVYGSSFILQKNPCALQIMSEFSHTSYYSSSDSIFFNIGLSGRKKRVILFRHLLTSFITQSFGLLQKKWSFSVYRKFGIAPWHSKFFFRKGKKKFA